MKYLNELKSRPLIQSLRNTQYNKATKYTNVSEPRSITSYSIRTEFDYRHLIRTHCKRILVLKNTWKIERIKQEVDIYTQTEILQTFHQKQAITSWVGGGARKCGKQREAAATKGQFGHFQQRTSIAGHLFYRRVVVRLWYLS